MMKKNYMLMLCTILMAGSLCFTACGSMRNNTKNSTEAPYHNEVGNDLKDAGRNLMDSIKDTGDAIRDGVDNMGNGTNRTNP